MDERKEFSEEMIGNVMVDISKVMELAKLDKPKKITLFVSEQWKYLFFEQFKKEFKKTRNVGDLIKTFVGSEHTKEISKIIPSLVKNPQKIPLMILNQTEELETLEENKDFFKNEFGVKVEIIASEKSDNPKAKQAMPGKPAILLE